MTHISDLLYPLYLTTYFILFSGNVIQDVVDGENIEKLKVYTFEISNATLE